MNELSSRSGARFLVSRRLGNSAAVLFWSMFFQRFVGLGTSLESGLYEHPLPWRFSSDCDRQVVTLGRVAVQ